MPQFPFLRSNQDKEKSSVKDISPPTTSYPNSIFNSTSSPDIRNTGLSSQQQNQVPQFSHPFTSPSVNASTSTLNANPNNDSNNSGPIISPFIPTESPTSKYHPSRLLRRKASLGNKSNDIPTFTDSDPLPTSVSTSSSNGINEPITPSSPKRLPSSPRGFPSSPRGFFFDNTSSSSSSGSGLASTLTLKDKDSLISEREKFSTYPTRRGSDTSRINYNYGLPSPTAIKRSAFVYNGKLTSEGLDERNVVIIPSSSSTNNDEEELSNNLGALGIGMKNDTITAPPLSSSLPKVLDGGLGSTSGIGIFGKIMNGNNEKIIDNRDIRDRYERPPTPPDSATTPFYPTALSPPRRPMPRSPRAIANSQQQYQQQQRSSTPTSYSYNNDHHQTSENETPPSISMIQAISAVGGPSSSNWNNNTTSSSPNLREYSPNSINYRQDQTSSPTPLGSSNRGVKSDGSGRRGSEKNPKITKEWLSRKPSLSSTSTNTTPTKQRKHRPSLSVDQTRSRTISDDSPSHSRQQSSDSPSSYSRSQLNTHDGLINTSISNRQGSLGDSPKIIEDENSKFGKSSFTPSTTESDTDLEIDQYRGQGSGQDLDLDQLSSDADGEIGLNPRRKSLLSTPSRMTRKSTSASSGTVGGYEVIVNCIHNNQRTTSDGDGDQGEEEIKWEVIIKKQRSQSHNIPTSPVQLSTSGVNAQAPNSASSINLSLSLDQPTGKLVFISFPMDINATPTRKRRPSTISRLSSNYNNNNLMASPRGGGVISSPFKERPHTPPNQIQFSNNNNNGTNDIIRETLIRTPSNRRKPPPPWPSPRSKLEKPISPPSSPKDVFTPKNVGTPSRMGVNGDLLNKVTRGEGSE